MTDVVPVPTAFGGRLLARSFLSVLSGDLFAKAAVFLTTFAAVRSLDALAFGQYVGLAATALLAATLWDCGLSSLVTREFAAGHLALRPAVMQVCRIRARMLPVWLLTFTIGAAIINRAHPLSIVALVGFGGASLFSAGHAALLAIVRGRLRFGAASAAFAAGRWYTALLSLLALPIIHLAGRRLGTFALALLAGEALTFGVAAIMLRRRAARAIAEPVSHHDLTLRAALPFAANGILGTLYNRFDVILVAALTTSIQFGFYATASRMQDAVYLVPGAVQIIALPLVARTWGRQGGHQDAQQLTGRLILLGLGICVPLTVMFSLFTPQILHLALGPQYVGATTATRILIWSLPFAAIGAPLLGALAGSGHASDTTKVFAVAFVVAILMHLSLDWRWGAIGGAAASLSREPAAMLVTLLCVRHAGGFQRASRDAGAQTPAVH